MMSAGCGNPYTRSKLSFLFYFSQFCGILWCVSDRKGDWICRCLLHCGLRRGCCNASVWVQSMALLLMKSHMLWESPLNLYITCSHSFCTRDVIVVVVRLTSRVRSTSWWKHLPQHSEESSLACKWPCTTSGRSLLKYAYIINFPVNTIMYAAKMFSVLFNKQTIVTLADSDDYRFVHVESMGVASSYNPRTSRGDHQVMVHVRLQDSHSDDNSPHDVTLLITFHASV